MNDYQQAHARQQAAEMIGAGADPQGLVHVIFYPADAGYEDEIQGLSTPLPAGSELNGLTSRYYTLAELSGGSIGMWPCVFPGKSVTEWIPVTTRDEAVRLLTEDFNSSPYGWATWELGLDSAKAQLLAAIGGVAALRA